MHNRGASQAKTSNFIFVGFGFIVLWFGFICFAAMNIVSMLEATDNTLTSQLDAPTTLNIRLFERREEAVGTQLADVEQLLETPISDINLYAAYLAAGDAIGSPTISKIENDAVNTFRNSDVDDMIFGSTVTVLSER